jgi:hypothetical protein
MGKLMTTVLGAEPHIAPIKGLLGRGKYLFEWELTGPFANGPTLKRSQWLAASEPTLVPVRTP